MNTAAALAALGVSDANPQDGAETLEALDAAGIRYREIDLPHFAPISLRRFSDTHRTGRYFLVSANLAIALVDGFLTSSCFIGDFDQVAVLGALEILC